MRIGQLLIGLGVLVANGHPAFAWEDLATCGNPFLGPTSKVAVNLANQSCANGWTQSKYKSWGVTQSPYADGYGRQRISNTGAPLQLLKIDRNNRMAQVAVPPSAIVPGGEKLGDKPVPMWINIEALRCGTSKSVSDYVLPLTADASASCPTVLSALPISVDPSDIHTAPGAALLAEGFFDRAKKYIESTYAQVHQDNLALAGSYEKLGEDKKLAALRSAKAKFEKLYLGMVNVYGPRCSCDEADWKAAESSDPYFVKAVEKDRKSSGSGEFDMSKSLSRAEDRAKLNCKSAANSLSIEQMQRTCRSVRDSMDMLSETLNPEETALARFKSQIEAAKSAAQPENQQISVRMAIMYGLDLEFRDNSLKGADPKLNYYRMVRANGLVVPEVHNGYFLGAGSSAGAGSALDCGGFAMAYMFKMTRQDPPPSSTRSVPSVPDFNNLYDQIAGMGAKGNMDDYVNCFKVVSLRKDERLLPGDLVSSEGHIVVVRHYDAESREIDTFEARSGTFGTIGYGRLPLLEPDCNWGKGDPRHSTAYRDRPIRSDLRILRYVGGPKCTAIRKKDLD